MEHHHHYPPSLDKVNQEIEQHLKKNKDLAQIFEVYKGILKAQIELMDKIDLTVDLTEEEIKDYFRKNTYLLSDQTIEINAELFKEALDSVCKAIKEASPEAPDSLLKLSEAEEFKEENLQEFIKEISLFSKKELEEHIKKEGMDQRVGLDSEVVAFTIFMSLTPFYSLYMKKVAEITDFSLWRQSYCPVCGQKAVIAKHSSDSGARIMECWLCHAQWGYPRVECPYCDNKDHKKLRFFYVPEDKARQVHVCEVCKKYLKTIDSKALEKDSLLDIEAIATTYLDALAEREGYKSPDESVPLN
ncbi:MAG: formate dehydrogenase accessory protein FdhE [Candidatus Syntrophonatronum acetioxidans]|uniref:Formate dehydrogenase accessory protein FdhE n=1 Tax=Candidatus Syntrophonatronum acetioxidans TaxID=1795816 RepID=A0A424YHM4_9FIRM|nr:MAG: formate dehydrogenase accessory protein FdhE [Candidatus Syntrophonatronum acetioxidans]